MVVGALIDPFACRIIITVCVCAGWQNECIVIKNSNVSSSRRKNGNKNQ